GRSGPSRRLPADVSAASRRPRGPRAAGHRPLVAILGGIVRRPPRSPTTPPGKRGRGRLWRATAGGWRDLRRRRPPRTPPAGALPPAERRSETRLSAGLDRFGAARSRAADPARRRPTVRRPRRRARGTRQGGQATAQGFAIITLR